MTNAASHPYLVVVGGGNMGKAIVVGCVNAGILSPHRVCVADPAAEKRARFGALGVHVVATAWDAMAWLGSNASRADDGQVLLAIKPQSLLACADELKQLRGALMGRVVISILAGATTARVRECLGGDVRVVRAMPNLPAAIGKGVTALCLGSSARAEDATFARQIFAGIGPAVIDLDESMMDAFTAVAGSGPAYVFYLAESMVQGALRVGFSREDALKIVRATLVGSAAMLEQTTDEPAALREAVTSKGGTTEAALRVLGTKTVLQDFADAIEAARDRGRELA
ncbi:MAG TPA: pyrroline-5-carboxylate reductase [Phycisphaerales bacterium]|nr:pyrroline-5-carboxylate reductase [Phycisphaerales bacterium]